MTPAQNSPKLTETALAGSKSVALPKRLNFTKNLLDRIQTPAGTQRSYYYDTRTRGLALAVNPGGKKTFILYRKVQGRPERITIGAYPDLTIDQARKKTDELNGLIARGENPAERKRVVRDEMTLQE